MMNDPIHHNIYQSRLPATFEYKHPASELDYIVKHPRLLSTLLGEDALENLSSPFTAFEPVCELDAGTLGPDFVRYTTTRLRRNKTVISPLRNNFALFEREDRDTEKEALCGPSICRPSKLDTEEFSGIELANRSLSERPKRQALRRKLTRIFYGNRKHKCNTDGKSKTDSVETDDISSAASCVPHSLHRRGHRNLQCWRKYKVLAHRTWKLTGKCMLFALASPISLPVLVWRRRRQSRRCETSSITSSEDDSRIMSWLKAQYKRKEYDDEMVDEMISIPYYPPPQTVELSGHGSSAISDERCMVRRRYTLRPHDEQLNTYVSYEVENSEIIELPSKFTT